MYLHTLYNLMTKTKWLYMIRSVIIGQLYNLNSSSLFVHQMFRTHAQMNEINLFKVYA